MTEQRTPQRCPHGHTDVVDRPMQVSGDVDEPQTEMCDECKGTGYWSNYPPKPDRPLEMMDCCGVCCGRGRLIKEALPQPQQPFTLGEALPAEMARVRDEVLLSPLDCGVAELHVRASIVRDLDRAARALAEGDGPADSALPEDAAIKACHPTRSERHDLWAEALRLVGAKHSKYALVELVNWLLHRLEEKS